MLRLVEELPGIASIGYDDALGVVVISWVRNDNDAFQPMLETQLRLIQEHDAAVVIVNTLEATGAVSLDNQIWLSEDFFPRLSASPLKALITVVPRSATAILVNRRSFRDRDVPFEIVETSTLDEAYALASAYVADAVA